jgi:hypothetical protein
MKKIITVLLTVLMVLGSTAAVYAAAPADGTYSVATTLQGGSGRTSVKSPSTLTVSGGQMTATVVFNSSNFTWMQVGGVTYNNANPGGNSTFHIPVSALDTAISVSAETVAMSEPHVIDYVLTFSSSGVTMQGQSGSSQSSGSSEGSSASEETSGVTMQGQSGSSQSSGSSEGSSASEETSGGAADTDDNSADADADEEQEVIVEEEGIIEINNSMSGSTSVSEDMLSESEGKTMSLETASGRVEFDEDATAAIAKAAKGGITLTMSDVTDDYTDKGYAQAIDITLTDDEGNDLESAASEGKISITLNLDEDMEISDSLTVFALTDEGEEQMDVGVDRDAGTAVFDAEFLGTFAVNNASSMDGSTAYIAVGIAVAVIVIAGVAYFVLRGKKKK